MLDQTANDKCRLVRSSAFRTFRNRARSMLARLSVTTDSIATDTAGSLHPTSRLVNQADRDLLVPCSPAPISSRGQERAEPQLPRYRSRQWVYLACRHGSFGNTPAGVCWSEKPNSTKAYALALITFDAKATPAEVVARDAVRWWIEPSNATGKQQMGVGQARNHLPKAVQRTIPSCVNVFAAAP